MRPRFFAVFALCTSACGGEPRSQAESSASTSAVSSATGSGTMGSTVAGATAGGTSSGGAVNSSTGGGTVAVTTLGGVGAGGASSTTTSASGGASGATATGGMPSTPEWQETLPTFTRHAIADFASGYFVLAVDVDGDGQRDVVALSSGSAGISWFKNPGWEAYEIALDTERLICMAAHDVDGDGDLDLAIGSEFSLTDTSGGGTLYWAEAPDDPTQTAQWPLHPIDAVPTSHRVRFGDIDGDGTTELVNLPIFGTGSSSPEYVGPVQLGAYSIPGDPSGPWQARVLDDSLLEVAHGLTLVDFDGDAGLDILAAANAGVYLFRPAIERAPAQLGVGYDGPRPDRGSSEVGLGQLGQSRFLATIEPWHGTDQVVYTPGEDENQLWNRRVIGEAAFERGHAMAVADLNGDGYDEIVGGDQNGGGALLLFRYVPVSDEWETIELDTGEVAVIGIDVQDLDGDGDLDIAAIGGSSNNVVWYENSL